MTTLSGLLDPQSYGLVDQFTRKSYPVSAIQLAYETIDGKGIPTIATGVIFLPFVTSSTQFPVFSYLHGTLMSFAEVPSKLAGIESIIGWIMAMDGYISILPDYIGMGAVPGQQHPYCHAASEASASIDMLKAAMQLCGNPMVLAKPDGNLYLCGYSQGAHAVLATQRELQITPVAGLNLSKTVAGSGAYSLSYIQKNYLFDHSIYPSPSFLPYLLLGYQSVYGNLYSDLSQVFTPYYSALIPQLFNGLNTGSYIDAQLPEDWKTMFKPGYLSDVKYRYFHPVNVALRLNDVINWKPRTDLHLYYSTGDEVVARENSLLAYMTFLLKGSSKVTCLPVGSLGHAETAPYVLLLAKIQFDLATGMLP